MSQMKFGCQTYSWQMSYDMYSGKLPHIMRVMHDAGFSGIEAEACMMGHWYDDPAEYASLLKEHGLQYAALALPLDWRHAKETDEEYFQAQKAIAFLKHFPGTILLLCHLPGQDRSNLAERQANQIACLSAIAARAKDAGIVTAFHPNSSFGSAFRTAEDYAYLLEMLEKHDIGYCPDAGHIAHGGMDPVQVIRKAMSLVRHVHFKDMDENGVWRSMGCGKIDFPAIVSDLSAANYSGWVMVEEESADAVTDPDGVTQHNGQYFQSALLPRAK